MTTRPILGPSCPQPSRRRLRSAGRRAGRRHGDGRAGPAAAAPVDGASGIGDPYWPLDGNGGIDVATYKISNRYALGDQAAQRHAPRSSSPRPSDLASFSLDFLLRGLEGDRRRREGRVRARPTAATSCGSPRRAPLAAGSKHTVVVAYDDHPARYSYAGERNWLASKREVVAMNEPHMAPWWFPANDHPLDKAIVDVRIRVPNGREVISNGELRAAGSASARRTWHWRADEPMVPYLAFFAAGDFTIEKGTHQGLPWLVAVSQGLGQGDQGASMRLMKRTPGGHRRPREGPRRLPVLGRRRAHHRPQPGLRAGEPDPAHLSRRSAARYTSLDRPRARPPVVRRRHRGAAAGATSGSTRASPPSWSGAGRRRTAAAPAPRSCAATTPNVGADSDFWKVAVADPGLGQGLRRRRSTAAAR